ncbi:class I SAM-dependent methyltransferase [Aeromicrobium sp.]|uniref:class I SAM-dependent methyltransferase n=1 Tax=Aeromicrobium sp. TaxID=1871063 RepID=UPI003C4A6308
MTEHYFSNKPTAEERRRRVRFSAWGNDLELATSSGVFAGEGLDKATAILLRQTSPPKPDTTVLDLGCGWGPIACAMAVASPEATVWATDVNERALEMTRLNAESMGVDMRVEKPEDFPVRLKFDEIWSNPPIRIGKAALHKLLLEWLPRLKPDGRAHLVVGKNLGADSLQRWLDEQGWPTDRMAAEQSFRVLAVHRP